MAAETKGQEPQDVEMSESGKVPEPLGQVGRNRVSAPRAIYYFHFSRTVLKRWQWALDGSPLLEAR